MKARKKRYHCYKVLHYKGVYQVVTKHHAGRQSPLLKIDDSVVKLASMIIISFTEQQNKQLI